MKSYLSIVLLFLFLSVQAEEFSLRQCINYALDNNNDIKLSTYDRLTAQKKIDEQVSTMLPQVSVSGSVNDNYVNKTETPAVKTGSTWSTASSVELTQKIINPSFPAGIKAAKIISRQSALNLEQVKELTVYSVCRVYYEVCIIQKQYTVLDRVLKATKETLDASELKFNLGAAKKIDVDRNRISYNNELALVQQSKLRYVQSLNTLKNILGMSVDSTLFLSDTTLIESGDATDTTTQEKYWENRIDYKLLKLTIDLQNMYKKSYQAGYLPSLSFNAAYSYQNSSSDFSLVDKWYTNPSAGLRLSIPVFDGFQKSAQITQVNNAISKAKENCAAAEQSIKVDVSNYLLQYRIAQDNLVNQRKSLELAEDVYKNTLLGYQQGTEPTLNLIQAESAIQDAQNNYFTTLLNFYYARLDLEKSKGTLMNFVENIK